MGDKSSNVIELGEGAPMNVRFLRLLRRRIETGKKIDGVVVDDEARRRGLVFLKAIIEAIETDPRGSQRLLAETGRSFASNLRAALDSYGSLAGIELSPDVRKLADLLFFGAMRNAAQGTASELAPKARSAAGGRRSGVSKRKKAEKDWRRHARCAAREIILAEPAPNKHRLACRIQERLAGEVKHLPDVKTITRLLVQMEGDGEISFFGGR